MSLRKLPPGVPGALRIGVIEAFQEMGHPAQLFHRPHAQSRVALEDTGENQMPERDPHPVIRIRQERRALRQLSSGGGIPANGRFVAMCKLKCISRSWAAAQKG